MPREFVSEYGLDPGDYTQRVVDEALDRCPKLSERTVDEAIFVDEGPVNYLVWFVLEDCEEHTFFYYDTEPDDDLLQRLLLTSPSSEELPVFKALLRKQYDVYRELEIARLLELPDTYLPQLGDRPRAQIGFCHEPGEDQIFSGLSGSPRRLEREIFDDVDKLVPEKDLEKFISRTIQAVNEQVEAEADRHCIDRNIRPRLERDDDFRLETTKSLPKGIHPQYTGTEAELWQKPASKVDFIDGSQGFLQVWLPVDEDDLTLISATAGEYDREAIVDSFREKYESVAV